ncbi:hypothetical protein [Franconibacter daqui]
MVYRPGAHRLAIPGARAGDATPEAAMTHIAIAEKVNGSRVE